MSNIRYELFGSGAALASCDLCGGELTLSFPENTEGFIRIGARIYKLVSSRAEVAVSELDDGVHAPHLFTPSGEYILPGFEKVGKTLKIAPPESMELRKNELMLRRLAENVISLEKQLNDMRDMIRTTTLF